MLLNIIFFDVLIYFIVFKDSRVFFLSTLIKGILNLNFTIQKPQTIP